MWIGCTKLQNETESFPHLSVFNLKKTCIKIFIRFLFITALDICSQSITQCGFLEPLVLSDFLLQNTTIIIGYYNRSTRPFGKCQVKYKTSKYHKAEI